MSCDLLNGGIAKTCGVNLGGIKKLYLANKESVDTPTVSGGVISTLTMDSGTVFYEFEFNKNTSSFTEEMASDLANGSEYYNQTITLVIPKREATKRETIALLAYQRDLIAIVTDQNGTNWYFGLENGVNLTGNTGGSGTAKADLNGYTLTFTGEEPAQAPTISDAAVASVL
jgi:hypothetical protein